MSTMSSGDLNIYASLNILHEVCLAALKEFWDLETPAKNDILALQRLPVWQMNAFQSGLIYKNMS